jgi:TonB family protein
MTPASAQPRSWSPRRWGGVVGLVFVVQLGLIFWLGSTAPIRPRPAAPSVAFRFAGRASAELLALTDPTLFALPHQRNLAAPVLPRMPPPDHIPSQSPPPTSPPLPSLGHPGIALSRLVETNDFAALLLPSLPRSAPTIPEVSSPAVTAGQSVLQLEGGLAGRRLRAPLELKSWTHPEILASSVVEVVVDAAGRPVSAELLSRSGSEAADLYALAQARTARFEPAEPQQPGAAAGPTALWSYGRMVFRWHTIAAPPASASAAGP